MNKREPITMKNRPIWERLKYRTDGKGLHGKVIEKIKARLKLSYDTMSDRYSDWDKADEQVRLFMNLDRPAENADGQYIYNDDGTMKQEIPFQRSVVIPVSYIILNVRLSQLMNIIIGREPMWSLEGRGPEDVNPSRLMEACLEYDMEQCRAVLALYQFFLNSEKYGIGIMYDTWMDEYGWKTPTLNPMAKEYMRATGMTPAKQWDVVKEYNNWIPIDPFSYFPDPRVPRSDLQKGEFVGHRIQRSYLWLKERSIDSGGPYFNTEFLPKLRGSSAMQTLYTPKRDEILASGSLGEVMTDPDDVGYFHLDHFQIKLIPKEWQLGPGTDPEIWWFTMANESIILRAHPSSYDHGRFTYAVGESNPDIHSPFNPGNVENLHGIQKFMNWMLNSHFENIRKHLNDVLVICPTYVEMNDILNPGPARHFRLTQEGEELVAMHGISPDHFVKQLALADVTTPHLQACQFLWEMVTRMFGTTEPDIGHPTEEKKTLGEIKSIVQGSGRRLAVAYRLYEVMALHPLVERAIQNRQQFTSLEQYMRITGVAFDEMGSRELITPIDIQGNFDYAPRSEILPPDPAKSAIAWSQILFGLGKFPQVWAPGPDGRILDPRKIFNEVARNMGVKHINQFYTQLPPMPMMPGMGPGMPPGAPPPQFQVMPDQKVQQEAKKGNLQPMRQ